MRRLHLMEIHEQKWFPQIFRDALTDGLQHLLNCSGYHKTVASLLQIAMCASQTHHFVDLCSGAGGPWPELSQILELDQRPSVCLTDKFPNQGTFEKLKADSGNRIDFSSEPVDAQTVPASLSGFRTLFNSFHHFEPENARCILRNAIDSNVGIAIFELPRRSFATMCATPLLPIGLLLLLPLIRPFHFSLFVFTYLIPVLPFVVWFDGVVSCLRAYTTDELSKLAPSVEGYCWKAGQLRASYFWTSVTYLIGYPRG